MKRNLSEMLVQLGIFGLAVAVPTIGCGGPMESEGAEDLLMTTSQEQAASPIYTSQPIVVPESAYDVDTGVDIPTNSRVVISCSGKIWAGVLFTFENGPQGWTNYAAGNDYPLPGSPRYGMLAKLGGSYQYIGAGKTLEFRDGQSRLFLRINDDVPKNGYGAFSCTFSVYTL
jgi:hypothetical protein